jgi:hypothetical protein
MFKTISRSPKTPPTPITISETTGTKITYTSKGDVLSSTYLREADIPDLSISKITSLQEELDAIAAELTSIKQDYTGTFLLMGA